MKKKLSLVGFFTVLFLAVGAFHYQGTQSTVTATNNENSESSVSEKNAPSDEIHVTESTKENQNANNTETEESSRTESEERGPASGEINNSSSTDTGMDSNDEKPAKEPESPKKEKVKVGDAVYVDITDMEKFKELGGLAQKYGARLYGIENSDCFAIIKDGEPLLMFSVGTVSTGTEDLSVLKDYFKFHGFAEESGISGNIDLVAETGAKVQVELPDGSGYYIFKEDNRIVVNWG